MLVKNDFYSPSRLLKGNGCITQYGTSEPPSRTGYEADCVRDRKGAQIVCACQTPDSRLGDYLLGKVLGHRAEYNSIHPLGIRRPVVEMLESRDLQDSAMLRLVGSGRAR